jgi:hypothetical protein
MAEQEEGRGLVIDVVLGIALVSVLTLGMYLVYGSLGLGDDIVAEVELEEPVRPAPKSRPATPVSTQDPPPELGGKGAKSGTGTGRSKGSAGGGALRPKPGQAPRDNAWASAGAGEDPAQGDAPRGSGGGSGGGFF